LINASALVSPIDTKRLPHLSASELSAIAAPLKETRQSWPMNNVMGKDFDIG
jgi:hypothetical protein